MIALSKKIISDLALLLNALHHGVKVTQHNSLPEDVEVPRRHVFLSSVDRLKHP
jgi:hypothetical protein